MTWDLVSSKVDLKGYLSVCFLIKCFNYADEFPQFQPDIEFWLNANNTYRVVFIQADTSRLFIPIGN